MQRKRGKLVAYVILLALSFSHISCSEKKEFKVLVIHSYEQSYTSYSDFNEMISGEFDKRKVNTDIRTFYLDCELYLEVPELKRMSCMLDSLADWHPDIILVNDDQATYSLLKCGNPLVHKIPIVFAGVNYPNWPLIEEYPNATGFHDKIEFERSIRMMQHFYGKEKSQFAAVLDSTYLDRQIMADAQKQLKETEVIAFGKKRTKEERERLREEGNLFLEAIYARINQKEMVLNLSQYAYTRCIIQLKRDFTTTHIGNLVASPYFTAINEGFGYGEKMLGGYITPLPVQAEEAVEVVVRILQGANPLDIPIAESRKMYMLDWNVVQELGVPKEKIPADFEIINMPFKERYREWWLLLVIASITVSTTLFAILIFLYRREQKRKQRALRELADEKESLALAIQGSDTFAWKLEDNLFHFEDAFGEATGIPTCELNVNKFADLIHYSQQDEFKCIWEKHPEPGKGAMQLRLNFNELGYQWWEIRYSITLSDHEHIRVTGLLMNIQKFKERERELEEARSLAEKAELKQSFLANMSHEIRTPLNSIVGFSNILASDMELEEEEKQEYIETINRNSDLLLKLVNDILELSRIESGYMSFVYEECLATDLVNEVFATHQLLVPSRLAFLKENEAAQVMIKVDKGRLTQVITNFLNNAVKFTQEGHIKVGCKWVEDKGEVHFFVEDTGKGIPKEEQQMIFSRFYKQDEFVQGTGLGLSICKVIIGKLNGKIELWSEPGVGSCFTVVLPGIPIS